jgi:hypothetical protein
MKESGRLPVEAAGAAVALPPLPEPLPPEPADAADRPDRAAASLLPLSRLMPRARSPAISCAVEEQALCKQEGGLLAGPLREAGRVYHMPQGALPPMHTSSRCPKRALHPPAS